MNVPAALNAIDLLLKNDAEVYASVNGRIDYARGAVSRVWPLITYFEVSANTGYVADYDRIIVQCSIWAESPFVALDIASKVEKLLRRFRGPIVTPRGTVDINWTSLVDAGALPQADERLFGQFLRYEIRYRGQNLGGV